MARTAPVRQRKVAKVMREFAHHTLHSGSKRGPVVHSRKQALAIAYSEARRGRPKSKSNSSGSRPRK